MNTFVDDDAESYVDEDDLEEVRLHHWLDDGECIDMMKDSGETRADSPLLGFDHFALMAGRDAQLADKVCCTCGGCCPADAVSSLCRSCRRRFPVSARILPRLPPSPIILFQGPPSLPPRLPRLLSIAAARPTAPRLLPRPVVLHWPIGHPWRCCPSLCPCRRLLLGSLVVCTPSHRRSPLAPTAMRSTSTLHRSAPGWMSGLFRPSASRSKVCPRSPMPRPRTLR